METRNVNITPGGTTPIIHVSQNDVGRTITLNVTDGSSWYDLTGCTAKLEGIKPSGLGYSVTGTVSGHTVTIVTTKQMTGEAGSIASELKIAKTNVAIGTANIILSVEPDPHPESTTDGDAEELISELTLIMNQIHEDVEKAEVLSESEAWAVGKRDGVDVPSTDDTYHNNSKYYKELAGTSASAAAGSASDANNSKQAAAASASAANQSQLDAAASATAAANSAELAAQVFHVEGDVTFAVAQDGGVSMIFTEEE